MTNATRNGDTRRRDTPTSDPPREFSTAKWLRSDLAEFIRHHTADVRTPMCPVRTSLSIPSTCTGQLVGRVVNPLAD